jgi:hypothetical protein
MTARNRFYQNQKMKKFYTYSLLLTLMMLMAAVAVHAQEDDMANRADNETCLKCHGETIYHYYNDWTERDVKKMMNPFYVIDSSAFYAGTHHQFKCIDCHSGDYVTFPHPGELRYEPIYTCLDCHGDDESYAKYHFEEIDEEFLKSVHSPDSIADFSCWNCHDPHSFRLNVRTGKSIKEIVSYANEVCFACHTNQDKFELMSGETRGELIASHDWLPNQSLHFSSVRCIECHNQTNDSLLVAHRVLPAKQAVRKCAECHSQNSLLLSTLYKHQVIESRSEEGLFNAVIVNEAYVIGANRSYLLNIISIAIFVLTLGGIAIHALLRKIIKPRS